MESNVKRDNIVFSNQRSAVRKIEGKKSKIRKVVFSGLLIAIGVASSHAFFIPVSHTAHH